MTAQDFNRLHPVGTWVRYYPTKEDRNRFGTFRTRRAAYTLSGGTAVVALERIGVRPLDNLEIVPVPEAIG